MQLILPLIPFGATKITDILSCVRENGNINYYVCMIRIGSHKEEDEQGFKHKICELISNGTCRNRDIQRSLGIPSTNLKRWLRMYVENGAEGFYQRQRTRSGTILTDNVLIAAQELFNRGLSRREVSNELSISYDVIRKAVKDGRLHLCGQSNSHGTTRTERSIEDAENSFGVACVRTVDRILASTGIISQASPQFDNNKDIENAGILCALPALIENGLFRYLSSTFTLPGGYYGVIHIISLLAFMVLLGIPIIERLRFESPGEMGKLLGLDRIPEVRTLRKKLTLLCIEPEKIVEWSRRLCKDWFEFRPDLAGILYIDGHVSAYYGEQTKLPRKYCARLRFCIRGSTFYYVNDILGQPFFSIEQVVDEGLLKTLRNLIVPRLLELVPNQPSEEELKSDPLLCRFIIIFDREGYSPAFFKEMWEKHRIGCITYHKYPKEDWDKEEFIDVEAVGVDDKIQKMKLAERFVVLGDDDKEKVLVKEVRRLTDSGHQTSIISTAHAIKKDRTAIYMFNRWVQENFFKYMLYMYDIDSLIEYGTEAFSGPVNVVNPSWKALDYRVNSTRQKLANRLSKFGKMELPSKQDSDAEKTIRQKAELLEEIEQFKIELDNLTVERKKHPKHISFQELPDDLKFERLKPSKRLLFDTIKMLAYRSETAMAQTIKPFLDREDSRVIIRQLMKSHADIIANNEEKILNVQIHRFTTKRHDLAIRNLLQVLNETETLYPGTDMKLVYSMIGEDNDYS